ncbi:phage minor head protein [Dermabacter hominis]|uniref:phage minor head protein n=1 Tax=Dermabacter hominis TaxID=36740 RepID=UPI002A4DF070|nr:phage head morphogenesis protein [Dermabacter hominis]
MNPDDVYRLEAAMQAAMDTHLDEHTRALARAWTRVWVDVSAEVEASILGQVAAGNVDDAVPLDPRRTKAALRVIEQNLDDLAAFTTDTLTASLPDVIGLGVEGETAMYTAQGVPSFRRADTEQINAMVARSTEQITAVTWPVLSDTHAAIARRLNRAVALGDNPRLVAQQIVADCERDMNMSLARALNISRTEMLDAMRLGQYVTDLQNMDILEGWVWLAHLDAKTCGSCIAQHGTMHAPEEEGPLDHHSGRCGRLPVTKSWAALSFTGIDDGLPGLEDGETWFNAQDEDTQVGILGRRGFDAWKQGDFPISSWSVRRDNANWRPGYFMAKPPKGY